MTLTARPHAPRIPGSSSPAECIACHRWTFDNFGDQWCADCLVDALRDAVETAERDLQEAVRLADIASDILPTDLLERAAALNRALLDE